MICCELIQLKPDAAVTPHDAVLVPFASWAGPGHSGDVDRGVAVGGNAFAFRVVDTSVAQAGSSGVSVFEGRRHGGS